MRIFVVIGTRAQAIKMAPVVQALSKHGLDHQIVLTGQHKHTVDDLLADFNLKADTRLYDAEEASTVLGGLGWGARAFLRLFRYFRSEQSRHSSKTIILVHGDTMSTLLGAIAGRLARCRVEHVEAGLRSGRLLDPFPEELIRRLVTRLAQTAYCPGAVAARAITSPRTTVVDTQENTLLDALRYVLEPNYQTERRLEDRAPFVVISAHRLATVYNRGNLTTLTEIATSLATLVHVVFVLHPVTEARLRTTGLLTKLEQDEGIELTPRMTYKEFIGLAAQATAVLTDGGGNQEELSYLGIRTIILRNRTERPHGLQGTAVLTGLNAALISDTVQDELRDRFQRREPSDYGSSHPSLIIATHMKDRDPIDDCKEP